MRATKLGTGAIASDDAVWLVGSACALLQRPFDEALFRQQFPPPYSTEALVAALDAYGIAARPAPIPKNRSSKLPAPAAVLLRAEVEPKGGTPASDALIPGEAANDAAPQEVSEPRPSLVVAQKDDHVVVFRAGQRMPQRMARDEFRDAAVGVPLALTRSVIAGDETDEAAAGLADARPFGFRWFVPELLKHRRIWRDVLLASLAIQLFGLAVPLLTQVVIDKVLVHHTHHTLYVLATAMAMIVVFGATMTWLRQYLVLHAGNRIDRTLGTRVFAHLLRLPLRYFERRPSGTLVARLQGIETIRNFLTGASLSLALDIPFLFVFMAILFAYSWQLTLVALAALVLIAGASLIVSPVIRARLDRQFLAGARTQAFVTEHLASVETIKALQLEPQLDRRYDENLSSYLSASASTRQLGNTLGVVTQTLEQAMTIAILVVGALLVMRGDGLTVGMLVAFQMIAGRMSQPLVRLAGLWQEFQQASVAVSRLGDLMNARAEPHSPLPSRTAAAGPCRIVFENVGFRHTEQHPWLLRNFSASFEPNVVSLVMGPSGSGKTTLLKLIQGLYRANEGRILIDGRDIATMTANELRAMLGVVPQETRLFTGTVLDNLQAANPAARFDDIVAACRMADIHDTIETLPQGYQTRVGEQGVGLSGGQRQRIAIARALLRRPRALLFDESTSNLDETASGNVDQALRELCVSHTVVVVSHRVPAVGDQIRSIRFVQGDPA